MQLPHRVKFWWKLPQFAYRLSGVWKAAGNRTSIPINFKSPKTNIWTAGVCTQIKAFSWSRITQKFILVRIVWCCRQHDSKKYWTNFRQRTITEWFIPFPKSSTVLEVFGIHYKLMQKPVQVPFPPWYQHPCRSFVTSLEGNLCSIVRKISSGILYWNDKRKHKFQFKYIGYIYCYFPFQNAAQELNCLMQSLVLIFDTKSMELSTLIEHALFWEWSSTGHCELSASTTIKSWPGCSPTPDNSVFSSIFECFGGFYDDVWVCFPGSQAFWVYVVFHCFSPPGARFAKIYTWAAINGVRANLYLNSS